MEIAVIITFLALFPKNYNDNFISYLNFQTFTVLLSTESFIEKTVEEVFYF